MNAFKGFLKAYLKRSMPALAAKVDWDQPIELIGSQETVIRRDPATGLVQTLRQARLHLRDGQEEILNFYATYVEPAGKGDSDLYQGFGF